VISSLYFYIVVSDGNQVGDCILLHALLGLKKGTNFPLLIVMWVQLFEFRPRTYNCDVTFDFGICPGQKSLGAHLNPPFCRISDYIGHLGSQLFRLSKYRLSRSVQLIERLDDISGYCLPRVHQHWGVRRQETRTQDRIIPVEDHTGLVRLGFLSGCTPYTLVYQLW
jgi:hypothetical protein